MSIFTDWQSAVTQEFTGYNFKRFQRDLLAGMTVAAVALPLSLAFGVASGATAEAGLVAAILAGIVIGFLGGAPRNVSGPTGAMSAILIVMATQFGADGILLIGFLAGLLLIVAGLLDFGRIIAFIPSPVITGFSSGIAIIIALGQIDNALGIKTPAAPSLIAKLLAYFENGVTPNISAVIVTLLVMAIMIGWARLPISGQVPGSLVSIIVATILVVVLGWETPSIGTIPRSILLENRLSIGSINWSDFGRILPSAFSVAILGTIQAVLVGAVSTKMSGKRNHNKLELVAQGIGNMIMPLFGGIIGTTEIARTSINIKSGGTTRLAPMLHGVILLLVALLFGPIIGRIPLSALAGVLIMTAWRMNDWASIRFYFGKRLKHAITAFLITLVSIVLLDLNQAILLGILISIVIFFAQLSDLQLIREKSPESVEYTITGPLFFASARKLQAEVEAHDVASDHIVLAMQGVSLIDSTGVEIVQELWQRQQSGGGSLQLRHIQPRVKSVLSRSGLLDEIEGARGNP